MNRSAIALVAIGAIIIAPATSAPDAAAGAQKVDENAIERVVTLGDSYSSGMGIHSDAEDYDDHGPARQFFDDATRIGASACHRELDSTPGARLAEALRADFTMVACAGATIEQVAAQLEVADIRRKGAGTLITVTVSGNDVRSNHGDDWADVLIRCISRPGCDDTERNGIGNLDTIEADLTGLYVIIGDAYPDASIRVVGYPRLMQSDRWCEGVTGVNRHEADWIDEQVDGLNERIGAATRVAAEFTGADIEFVSVVDTFDNHGACRFWQRDRFVNDSVLGHTLSRSMTDDGNVRDHHDASPIAISGASFHPSQKGYDAYFDALAATVTALNH